MMDKQTVAVQNQYHLYPFPDIPIGTLEAVNPVACNYPFVYYYCTHTWPSRQNIQILDAGCGTGFSTLKLLKNNPQAQVVAVDFSESSLEKAQQRIRAAGLMERVTLIQQDLQSLKLKEKFDYINCSGVLHHLNYPEKGLKALAQCLQPHGLMHLMLYSAHARHFITLTQKALRALQTDPQDYEQGLRLCREFLHALPEGHALKQDYQKRCQAMNENFGEGSAETDAFLVDTYLHICDRPLTLNQIFELLDAEKLSHIRFMDEPNWQPDRLLPTLAPYVGSLPLKNRYLLMDCLRLDYNYSFICGSPIERDSLKLKEQDIAQHSPVVTEQTTEDALVLINGLGDALALNPVAQTIWRTIDGTHNWKAVVTSSAGQFGFTYDAAWKALSPFLQQLQEGYFVIKM